MGLLDGIERLINEHGSATILKERIELANDKYSALEQKAINLAHENKTLNLNLEKAEIEIQNLKKLTEKSPSDRLEEVREKILLAVAQNEDATERQIAQISGSSELITTYHLNELKKSNMVNVQYTMGSDWAGTSSSSNWSISQLGLAYLVKNSLVA